MPLDLDAVRERWGDVFPKIQAAVIADQEIMTAVADIDALCDEVARLRAALEPFAEYADRCGANLPDDCWGTVTVNGVAVSHPTLGDCRRARAALNPSLSSASSERTNG